MKKTTLVVMLVFCFSLPINLIYGQFITTHDPLFMPYVPKPQVGIPYIDPVFNTSIRRLSNAVNSGNLGIVPQYSKRQAWNANDSLMILLNGDDGYFSLYDGNTYQFIRPFLDPVVGGEDVFWHPLQKNTIIYPVDSILYSFDVSTNLRTPLHVFTAYSWINGRGEGNLSNDGRYYAFIGQVYNYITGEVTFKDIVVYDLVNDQVVSTMSIPQTPGVGNIDWMSISPLGNFVLIDYSDDITGRYHGVEVYDRNMNFIWQKPLGAGHSDLGLDADGTEMLVVDVYASDSNITHIQKYKLSDGSMINLLEISPLFDLHISLRSMNRPGWSYISTFDYIGRLTDDSLSWLPFEDEVFTLKTDGSGDVQRIAHHHSRRYSPITPDPDHSVYWAEPHATVNKAGTKVLWGSNWRQNMDQVNAVDTYLCDFSGWLSTKDPEKNTEFSFDVFPNPVKDQLNISFKLSKSETIRFKIHDGLGKEIYISDEILYEPGFQTVSINTDGLARGIYHLSIQTDHTNIIKNFVVL